MFNGKKEIENVVRVARRAFGEENISQEQSALFAGEDFSSFSRGRPAAFFFGFFKMMSCTVITLMPMMT